ncbi:MAG TPA: DUF1330 domain-containing protein [Hypericibacter adhaerens]|uniref:DUF1330 domain-containing protein n=1 Tax=Hypericibacter adhaerens TaxID=2602016 RepID=UPI002CA72B13|nr:DUF1330 domain-containing protein [Hypericibacter adhaerens]HWA44663.1 DUF1330 domain-containing protein [Hypericibacter adhaerens]
MAAYVISEIEPQNQALFDRYRALAPAAVAKYQGRYLVRGGTSELIEGGPPPKMLVVIEFPSVALAKAWFDSTDYAEARRIAKDALRRRLIVVEGVPPGYTGLSASPT